jgi:hypothetical protein
MVLDKCKNPAKNTISNLKIKEEVVLSKMKTFATKIAQVVYHYIQTLFIDLIISFKISTVQHKYKSNFRKYIYKIIEVFTFFWEFGIRRILGDFLPKLFWRLLY